MESFALLIAATFNAGTVLAIAALGLLINEKSGIVNLGAEGMMLCAAIAGFAAVVHTGNDWAGFAAGMAAGAGLAAIFGLLVIWLNTNQYATGLALSLFGAGFSAFVGVKYVQEKLPARPSFAIPVFSDIPFIGPALFKQHPLAYVAIALALVIIWFLYKTRAGLVLRSVGESPESAHSLGYPVRRIRLLAVVFGGAMCGLSGAYLSVIYTPLWVEGMVSAEVQAAGRPPIGAAIGGTAEIVSDGVTGFLVADRTAAGFGKAMLRAQSERLDPGVLVASAKRFDLGAFGGSLRRFVDEAVDRVVNRAANDSNPDPLTAGGVVR